MPQPRLDGVSGGAVPVSMGSPRFMTDNVPGFEITDAWFPPGSVLPCHTHARPVVAVCLEGRIESHIGTRILDGAERALWIEPAGDTHFNVTSDLGARVLALQPDPARWDLFQPVASLLERPVNMTALSTSVAALRLHHELLNQDDWSPVSLQGRALDLLADIGREFERAHKGARGPSWLGRAEEMVRDRFREKLSIEEVAGEAGVHPMHLTRVFKKYHGTTVAGFQRDLRLDWAEHQLRTGDQPIGRIALRAGFSDQSHFTRVFKRHRGRTPGEIRRARPH